MATAAVVPPNVKGVAAVMQALGALTVCSGGALGLGLTDRFLQLDEEFFKSWRQHQQEQRGDFKNDEYETILSTTQQHQQHHRSAFPLTFARTLIMPGLVEELFWRVLCQPPGTKWSVILAVNAAFTFYHVIGSAPLTEYLDGRRGAKAVFSDPTFLMLAFVLGNVCSYAYIQAGYALWAPVFAHAIPVSVWLTFLKGEEALSTPGGLS